NRVSSINVCVFSLTEARDQLSQWRAYSSSGGYMIGFNTPSLGFVAKNQGFLLSRCIYRELDQEMLIADTVEPFLAGFAATLADCNPTPHKIHAIADRFVDHLVRIAPLLKHHSFEEEREWRLISQPIPLAHDKMRYRAGRGLVVPYFELSFAEIK